ncbi:hypothetical protein NQ317_006749 [Molorchus minor]|uniref:Uncharacterized protein n=1 Tax=Molorchus minor TaxID=1323400 RepID=A0ABQ9JBE2_9CUCU|nr:hypothetical protein NQ317_006749 [Molorchus minor]
MHNKKRHGGWKSSNVAERYLEDLLENKKRIACHILPNNCPSSNNSEIEHIDSISSTASVQLIASSSTSNDFFFRSTSPFRRNPTKIIYKTDVQSLRDKRLRAVLAESEYVRTRDPDLKEKKQQTFLQRRKQGKLIGSKRTWEITYSKGDLGCVKGTLRSNFIEFGPPELRHSQQFIKAPNKQEVEETLKLRRATVWLTGLGNMRKQLNAIGVEDDPIRKVLKGRTEISFHVLGPCYPLLLKGTLKNTNSWYSGT